jgi:DNA-binding GntR family transcriptional regulator
MVKQADNLKPEEGTAQSLRGKVFSIIEQDILNGVYKPGENLTETKLCEKLGVSRTPVREALTQLDLEGLVRVIPNKSAVVTGISAQDIRDIYTIRILIEGLAARWAAEHITDAELRELREALDLEEFYTAKKDLEHLIKLDSQFHKVLFKASKSRPLQQILGTFHHYVQQARGYSLEIPGRAKKALAEHKAILQAISERNGDRAEQLTVRHIRQAQTNLLRNMPGNTQ